MPTVHLAPLADRPAPSRVLPGRVDLTLGQLLLLARRAGDVPLPIDLPPDLPLEPDGTSSSGLHNRLSAGSVTPAALAREVLAREVARARGDDPASLTELHRLRVVDDAGTPAGEVVAALRGLAAPELLAVLDLTVDGRRLRSWLGVTGTRVSQLSTSSGVGVELAWADVRDLGEVLARAVTVETEHLGDPADPGDTTPVPDRFTIPFDLYTEGAEAARLERPDILAEMVARCTDPVLVDGEVVDPVTTVGLLRSLSARARGRLRMLLTVPDDGGGGRRDRRVGVVAWSRFDDDWWALTAVTRDGVRTVEARRAAPPHLGQVVAPILAQVLR